MDKLFIESAQELRDWLIQYHETKTSVWLVKWKKESGHPFISYDEIVNELICFGWVDSLPRKLDDEKTMLRISLRNPKSNWSKVNKERVARLLRKGRMEPAGLKLVEQAKSNGAWSFLDDVEELILPTDLIKALQQTEKASYYFERFPNSSKRGILEWIKNAKQEDTRQRRIKETVMKAAQNRKANHPEGRDRGPIDKSKT